MRGKEQITVLHDLLNQINGRLGIIGETTDAYFLCQCVEILKQQGQTIDVQSARVTELEALLADAQKDAARYQWLRSRIPGSAYRVAGIIYSEGGEGVDAGIDAAMQPKEQAK